MVCRTFSRCILSYAPFHAKLFPHCLLSGNKHKYFSKLSAIVLRLLKRRAGGTLPTNETIIKSKKQIEMKQPVRSFIRFTFHYPYIVYTVHSKIYVDFPHRIHSLGFLTKKSFVLPDKIPCAEYILYPTAARKTLTIKVFCHTNTHTNAPSVLCLSFFFLSLSFHLFISLYFGLV